MKSWTKLVRPRGWPSLRRILFAALALVVALAGGGHTAVAEENGGRMSVDFSYRTPEVAPGTICKGRQYQITAWPYVVFPDRTYNFEFHAARALVTVTPAILGTITPPSVRLLRDMGGLPALFHYTADRTGHESLRFTVALRRPVTEGPEGSETRIDRVDKRFDFVVKDCTYKVTFIWSTQFVGLVSSVTVGLMDETRLERQEDGTYKGSGSFVFKITNAVPSCVHDFKDIETLLRITGKLLPNSDELELNFDYGTGKLEATFTCSGGGGGKASGPWDISPYAPRTVKFPQEGGSKSFPINKWFRDETGNLTIIVTREEAAELGVGG